MRVISVKRLGHATLTTPDIERQIAYYTEVVGLTLVCGGLLWSDHITDRVVA